MLKRFVILTALAAAATPARADSCRRDGLIWPDETPDEKT